MKSKITKKLFGYHRKHCLTLYVFLTFIGIMLLLSCSQLSPLEKEIRKTLNKKVNMNMFSEVYYADSVQHYISFRNKNQFISLVYLRNSCSPCITRFADWHAQLARISVPDNYTVLFVVQGYEYKSFMDGAARAWTAGWHYPIVFDRQGLFMKKNKEVSQWFESNTLLISPENRVRMVGAPFANSDMVGLLQAICTTKK